MKLSLYKLLQKHAKYLLLISFTAGLYFIRIFSKIIFFKSEGLYAGHQNVWSDWALHITLTNTFANKPINEWFLYHPYFSGGKLTYGFLTNAISGLLIKLGLNIVQAMIWPSILLIFLFLIGMYFLYYQILESRKKSILGIFIFLTSAGPGFIKFAKELYLNPSLSNITYPPIDYTRILKYQWLAGNIPTAMLIPQRSFLIGITIGVWSLLIFIVGLRSLDFININKKIDSNKLINNNKQTNRQIKKIITKLDTKPQNYKKLLIFSGLLAGILPIAHMHSFIAIVIISGSICFNIYIKNFIKTLNKSKNIKISIKITKIVFNKSLQKLFYFVAPATVLSTILYFSFIHGGIEKQNFMTISLGWTAKKDILSWIKMWWDVWGIMVPIAVYGLFSLYENNLIKIKKQNIKYKNEIKKQTKEKNNYLPNKTIFFYGFFILFSIANIITFQPTAWDNTKLFTWIYLGFSLLASHVIVKLWKSSARNKFNHLKSLNITKKVLAIILLITLSTTGILELIRLQRLDKNTFMLSNTSGIKFAQEVMNNTNTDDIFLTATNHNHPIQMWGSRSIVLGYQGWVTNFGFNTEQRMIDVRNIFEKPAQSLDLIKKYNIDYIVIGEMERREFRVHLLYFHNNFEVAFKDEGSVIYKVK